MTRTTHIYHFTVSEVKGLNITESFAQNFIIQVIFQDHFSSWRFNQGRSQSQDHSSCWLNYCSAARQLITVWSSKSVAENKIFHRQFSRNVHQIIFKCLWVFQVFVYWFGGWLSSVHGLLPSHCSGVLLLKVLKELWDHMNPETNQGLPHAVCAHNPFELYIYTFILKYYIMQHLEKLYLLSYNVEYNHGDWWHLMIGDIHHCSIGYKQIPTPTHPQVGYLLHQVVITCSCRSWETTLAFWCHICSSAGRE